MLDDVTPILKGEAELRDGKKYWFRVNARSLEEQLLYTANDTFIYDTVDGVLKSSGLNYENTVILVGSEALNTTYFLDMMHKKYPFVKGIKKSYFSDSMRQVFGKIIEAVYQPVKKTPALRPALPFAKTAEGDKPGVAIKPGLPPAIIAKPVLPPINKAGSGGQPNAVNKPSLPDVPDGLSKLVGKQGVVTRPLNLTGKVMIDDTIYDAVSERISLEKGNPVKVTGVSGQKYLRVEKIILPPPLPKKN